MKVNVFNEWDRLQEVVVGHVEKSTIPYWEPILKGCIKENSWHIIKKNGGEEFDKTLVKKAKNELRNFRSILKTEGVKVRRPGKRKVYPIHAAMPRDLIFAIDDKIIEAPLSWKSRSSEIFNYRKIILKYFKSGAVIISPPKPNGDKKVHKKNHVNAVGKYIIKNKQILFDAADIIKCGVDIFVQKSNTTNDLGISWLKSILEPKFKVHTVEFHDDQPMHIDATFMPLSPGNLLINPIRVFEIPEQFRSWNIIKAPPPRNKKGLFLTSAWISMNVLMLDKRRIFVEKEEKELIEILKKHKFKPIPIPFQNVNFFGGSFHCVTVDINRKGKLENYF